MDSRPSREALAAALVEVDGPGFWAPADATDYAERILAALPSEPPSDPEDWKASNVVGGVGPVGRVNVSPKRAPSDPERLTYVPSPADLDDLCSQISACGYASEAVQIVEDWTRKHWAVESAFTTAMNPDPGS